MTEHQGLRKCTEHLCCICVVVQGYLAVSDLPLVSMDFKKSDVSTTIDSSLTMVMGDDMVKVHILATSLMHSCSNCQTSLATCVSMTVSGSVTFAVVVLHLDSLVITL